MNSIRSVTGMLTRITCAILSLVCTHHVHAQTWQQTYPVFPSDDIAALVTWNGDTVFAFGLNWTLQHSLDAGRSWNTGNLPKAWFTIVRASSDGRNILILPSATIYSGHEFKDTTAMFLYRYNPRTHDTAKMCVPLAYSRSYPPSHYYDLDANERCIAVLQCTQHVVVQLSTDHGATWETVLAPDSLDPRSGASVYFHDRLRGMVLCQTANDKSQKRVFVTSDGGVSWKAAVSVTYPANLYPGTYSKIPACWADDSIIVAVSSGNAICMSRDAGMTWKVNGSVPTQVWRIEMDSRGHGFVIGTAADMYTTSDYGLTWVNVKPEIGVGIWRINPVGLEVNDNVFIVGYDGGCLSYTSDAGLTWNDVRSNELYGLSDLQFFDRNEGVVQAYERSGNGVPQYYRTSDGGASWFRKYIVPNSGYVAIKHASPTIAYGFGTHDGNNDSLIFLTTDAGYTWNIKLLANNTDSLDFYNIPGEWSRGNDTMFVFVRSGLLRTTNRGDTWYRIADIGVPRKIMMNSGQFLWVLFKDSLLRSATGGHTWDTVFRLPDSLDALQGFTDLECTKDGCMFLIASRRYPAPIYRKNMLFTSRDDGLHWVVTEMARNVSGAAFLDSATSIGWPMTTGGDAAVTSVLYMSRDAWRGSAISADICGFPYQSGYGVPCFIDGRNGWVVNGGAVYMTTSGGVNHVDHLAVADERIRLFACYPNPVTRNAGASVTVEYTVPMHAAGDVQVQIRDVLGRIVMREHQGTHATGKNICSFDCSELRSGMYFAMLLAGFECEVQKIIVNR